MSVLPQTRAELDSFLVRHASDPTMSLREWIAACQQRSGHDSFVHMFVYDAFGGDRGVIKNRLQPATHEVARHGEIIGDWSVEYLTDQLLAATIVFRDGTLARIILLKTGDDKMPDNASKTKAEIIRLIEGEGDSVADLLGWTRNQPETKVPATYSMGGGVWDEMMKFRNELLAELPEIVSRESIRYLLNSQDKKYWMFHAILLRLLKCHDTGGIFEPGPKSWIIATFQETQRRKVTH